MVTIEILYNKDWEEKKTQTKQTYANMKVPFHHVTDLASVI